MTRQAALPAPSARISKASSPAGTDLRWVLAVTLASFLLASTLEVRELVAQWTAPYERWQLDELPLTITVLACGLAWYAWRRQRDAMSELRLRLQAQDHVKTMLGHNRELARQLIALQENERKALARELHDELGQSCSALRVETAFLRQCAADDRAGLLAAAARADAAALSLYQGVRDLLRRLRPANLDTLGLVAAVDELTTAWAQRSNCRCSFTARGPLDGLGDAIDITIYRVAQEALTNVLQHARADEVRVRLVRTGDATVELSVCDNGRGMDLDAVTRGLGLLGASERAAALGGTLNLNNAPEGGLQLLLKLPLAVRANGA